MDRKLEFLGLCSLCLDKWLWLGSLAVDIAVAYFVRIAFWPIVHDLHMATKQTRKRTADRLVLGLTKLLQLFLGLLQLSD